MNWYAARSSEIFCDIDSKKSLLRALRVLRTAVKELRLFNDMPCSREDMRQRFILPVQDIFYYPTSRNGHGHLIVTLEYDLDPTARARWALWLGSDRLRACYVLQRITEGFQYSADLLATSRRYHREPDDTCKCKEKHKKDSVTSHCPALRRLLGSHRTADYFPRVGTARKIAPLRVPIGKISKRTLIRWENRKHG